MYRCICDMRLYVQVYWLSSLNTTFILLIKSHTLHDLPCHKTFIDMPFNILVLVISLENVANNTLGRCHFELGWSNNRGWIWNRGLTHTVLEWSIVVCEYKSHYILQKVVIENFTQKTFKVIIIFNRILPTLNSFTFNI